MKRAHYDLFDYFSYWQGRDYENKAEEIAIGKFLAKIPLKTRESIVDIGAGFGRLGTIYAPLFKQCLLIDPSEKNLNKGRRLLKKFTNIKFKKGRAQALPAGESLFDAALAVRILHHIGKPGFAFKEIHRVLKPNGFFILEFANKNHFRARMRSILKGDFSFTKDYASIDQRSPQAISQGKIPFLNHHPEQIKRLLEKTGFEIIASLSVSNFRWTPLKTIIPTDLLLKLESVSQKPLTKFSFGPSLFYLCQKK